MFDLRLWYKQFRVPDDPVHHNRDFRKQFIIADPDADAAGIVGTCPAMLSLNVFHFVVAIFLIQTQYFNNSGHEKWAAFSRKTSKKLPPNGQYRVQVRYTSRFCRLLSIYTQPLNWHAKTLEPLRL